MTRVIYNIESLQYDGTNGSYICGTWIDVTLVSDDGTTLVYQDADSYNHTVNLNDYVMRSSSSDQYGNPVSPAYYAQSFYPYVEAPSYSLALAAGYALTPTIGASSSADVAVGLDTAFSGTSYDAHAVLAGSATLLGSLSVTAVVVTDTDTVTVTVHNSGLVSLAGATVIVTAAELTT